MKKLILIIFLLFPVFSFSNGLKNSNIIKVGIFYDSSIENTPGPSRDKFNMEMPASWYKKVLSSSEYKTDYITVEQLLNKDIFNRNNFDIVIFPYSASKVPFDIYENKFTSLLYSFLKDGSGVILTGGTGYLYPYDSINKKYLTEEEKKKVAEKKIFCDTRSFIIWKNSFPTFDVASVSFRNSVRNSVNLNPAFKEICPALPPALNEKGDKWPPYSIMLSNYASAGTGFKDDLIIPLYFTEIKDSRGNIKKAGPIWIVRYHNTRINSGTLIITFLRRWADYSHYIPVFSRPDGDKILKSLISLCFKKLPGEKEKEYYDEKIKLKNSFVELEKEYINFVHLATGKQQISLYKGEMETIENWDKIKNKIGKDIGDAFEKKNDIFNKESTLEEIKKTEKEVENFIKVIKKYSEQLGNQKNDYKPTTFYFSIQGGKPDFVLQYHNFKIAKEIGINLFTFEAQNGFFADYFCKNLGLKLYTGIGGGGHHGGISRIPCAIFDPRTKKNKENAVRKNWLYDEDTYQKVIDNTKSRLEKIQQYGWRNKIGMFHLPNEMHIRFNQGWGKRGMMLFREYLKKKYEKIEKVNEIWGTNYNDFSEITIPIKAPETQKEHAYWDDWTNFRDNIFNRYAKDLYTAAKKQFPEIPVITRYMGMNVQATKGNNFSVLNQYCDINGTHSYWNSALYTGDWLHRIGRKPFYNSEYTFHKYTKTGYLTYTVWLRRDLWHGTGNGQIGFQFFPWYWDHVPFFENYSFLESDGTPRMVCWELHNFIKKSGKWSDVVKKGKCMSESKVAFLWSDTSRRHQINNLGTPSPIFSSYEGMNALFRNLHFEREVITEIDIQKGNIPENVKFIIIPGSIYFEKETYKKLKEFVEKGGWVMAINSDGSYFDNRGNNDFTFFKMAGVVPREIPAPRFFEYKGKTIVDFGNITKWNGWKILNTKAETIMSSAEDYPVIVKVPYGKGGIILSSFPLGQVYLNLTRDGLLTSPFPQSALTIQKIIKDILHQFRIDEVADTQQLIEVHRWSYNNKEYLIITNLNTYKSGIFQISLPYSVEKIYDVINETYVPVKTEKNKTSFSIYLDIGDGLILKIER